MILVFGSLNLDLITQTPRLPTPGETVLGKHFTTMPGGKGANQAVAAARMGVPTQLVGRVGEDAFGQTLLRSLQQGGVDVEAITCDLANHSGVAAVAVNEDGENQIVVVPGANGAVNQSDVDRLIVLLPKADILLLQFELPIDAVLAAAKAAKEAGVRVILDPAPVPSPLPPEFYTLADILTPNQTEAAQLVGMSVTDKQSAGVAATALRQRGAETVIVKMGALGAYCSGPEGSFHVPAFPVKTVDTVGAGDAFNGGLAAALSEGLKLEEAVILASAIAALSTTQPGTQTAMPSRKELEAFLKR